MSDQEFADWLRSVPREKSPEQVVHDEQVHDREAGLYVPHHHHSYYGEAAH